MSDPQSLTPAPGTTVSQRLAELVSPKYTYADKKILVRNVYKQDDGKTPLLEFHDVIGMTSDQVNKAIIDYEMKHGMLAPDAEGVSMPPPNPVQTSAPIAPPTPWTPPTPFIPGAPSAPAMPPPPMTPAQAPAAMPTFRPPQPVVPQIPVPASAAPAVPAPIQPSATVVPEVPPEAVKEKKKPGPKPKIGAGVAPPPSVATPPAAVVQEQVRANPASPLPTSSAAVPYPPGFSPVPVGMGAPPPPPPQMQPPMQVMAPPQAAPAQRIDFSPVMEGLLELSKNITTATNNTDACMKAIADLRNDVAILTKGVALLYSNAAGDPNVSHLDEFRQFMASLPTSNKVPR